MENENALTMYEGERSPLVKCFRPTLTERGRIKIGIKGKWRPTKDGKSQYQLPEKVDHFILTKMSRKSTKVGEDQNFVEDKDLMESLPKDKNGKLTSIPIKLLYDDVTLNVQTFLSCYKGKTDLFCFGDGATASRSTGKGKKREQHSCPCQYLDPENREINQGDPICKINTKLMCEIQGQKELGGIWVFRSSSYHTGKELPGTLFYIALKSNGTLAGLKLNLVLTQRTGKHGHIFIVSAIYPGDENMVIDEATKIVEKRAMFKESFKLQEQVARKQLMSNLDIENLEEAQIEEIVDDFYPEVAEQNPPVDGEVIQDTDEMPTIEDGVNTETGEIIEEKEAPPPEPTKAELTEAYFNEHMAELCMQKPFGGLKFSDLKKKDKNWVYERMTAPPVEEEVTNTSSANSEDVEVEGVGIGKTSSPVEEAPKKETKQSKTKEPEKSFIEIPGPDSENENKDGWG